MNANFEKLLAKHLDEIKLIDQSLFSDDERKDRPWIAYIGANDWEWYAGAYKTAADILVGAAQDRTGHIDQLVYPIMALYRQSLELQLKRLYSLVFPDRTIPTTHNLDYLWRKLRAQWAQHPKPAYYSEHLASLGKRLKEFHKLDPTSQSSRYPTTTNEKASFEWSTVNLRKMKEIANAIHMFTDQVATDIEQNRNKTHVSFLRAVFIFTNSLGIAFDLRLFTNLLQAPTPF